MRVFAIIAAVLAVSAAPAFGQEAPDAARQAQLDRAGRYLELAQGEGMAKMVRAQLEEFYADGAIPEDERAWLADHMTTAYEDVMELVGSLSSLRKNADRVTQLARQITDLEEEADHLYDAGMKALFLKARKGDALDYMVGAEIYDHLEKVVDRFEDVANRISGVLIEHL